MWVNSFELIILNDDKNNNDVNNILWDLKHFKDMTSVVQRAG